MVAPGNNQNGAGGYGGQIPSSLSDGLQDPARERGTARMTLRAMREGWITPWDRPKELDGLPASIVEQYFKAVELGNWKAAATYAEILRKMQADNLALASTVDKITGAAAGEDNRLTVTYTNRLTRADD